MNYKDRLRQLGIQEQQGKQLCSKCSSDRKNSKDPCLSVSLQNDGILYNCHNCNWHGKIFYHEKNNYKKTFTRPEQPQVLNNKQLLYSYFEKRKISKDVVNKYKVELNNQRHILFTYYKDGELVNIKTRINQEGGKKTFLQSKDSEKTFYGMDLITDFNELIICEGEIDCLSFATAGIESVSVPQGGSEDRLECIDNCWEWLQRFDSYILAVDNDDTGRKLRNNLINRLGSNKCKTVDFGRFKDANEVLIADGNLGQIINNAESLPIDGVITFFDCYDEIIEFKEHGFTKGYSTGWSSLDAKFTIKTGYLMVISGYPSRGKSFFADNLTYNLSKEYGLKHLTASFENTNANHFARLAQMHTSKNFNTLDGDEFANTYQFINEHFYRLQVDRLWTIDQIAEATEVTVKRYGIKTLTIDPYNRLNNDYKDREDKYIGSILAKLSMLAKKLDILIIFIAHPKKPDSDLAPNMYSISGSSDWYNMADYGVIIHRERENTPENKLSTKTQVIVSKVKDFNIGDPSGGSVFLQYNFKKHILEKYTDSLY